VVTVPNDAVGIKRCRNGQWRDGTYSIEETVEKIAKRASSEKNGINTNTDADIEAYFNAYGSPPVLVYLGFHCEWRSR